MTGSPHRRVTKLESSGATDAVGFVLVARYPGQPVKEAWRDRYGDRPLPPGRRFARMPAPCATFEEWHGRYGPEISA